MASQIACKHPFDTPFSSGLRFLVEIFAWVAGPWAAAEVSDWFAIPTAIILIGLPTIFSTSGDKKQVVVATPGPARVLLELALHGVAVAAAWLVWPAWLAVVVTIVVVAALATGMPRTKWLIRGASPQGQENDVRAPTT